MVSEYKSRQVELLQKIQGLGKVVRCSKVTQLEDGLAVLQDEAMQLEVDWYTVPMPGDLGEKEGRVGLLLAEG
ncbi:hypothetical protein LCGC14_2611940, partial [marine sediment metagenome]